MWVQADLEADRNEEGTVVQWRITLTDVSPLKETETALKHERNFISQITEITPVGITVVNKEGQIFFANQEAEKIHGLYKDQLRQRYYNSPEWKITDYNGEPFPEEKLPVKKVMSTSRSVHNVRLAIEWPDGQRVYLLINSAPMFNEDGELEGVVSAVEDVSAQVKAEQELSLLWRAMQDSPVGIIIINTEGIIEYVNPAFSKITKYNPEEVIGQNSRFLKSKEHEQSFYDNLWQKIKSGQNWQGEIRNRTKNGELYWEQSIISPIRNEGGFITHCLKIVEDITEKKRTRRV